MDLDRSPRDYGDNLTLDVALDHLEDKKARLVAYFPERYSEYRPLIEERLGETVSFAVTFRIELSDLWNDARKLNSRLR